MRDIVVSLVITWLWPIAIPAMIFEMLPILIQ